MKNMKPEMPGKPKGPNAYLARLAIHRKSKHAGGHRVKKDRNRKG